LWDKKEETSDFLQFLVLLRWSNIFASGYVTVQHTGFIAL